MKPVNEIVTLASERPKRRHARPHELDSDDDDDEADDKEGKAQDGTFVEDMIAEKVETLVEDNNALQIQVTEVQKVKHGSPNAVVLESVN